MLGTLLAGPAHPGEPSLAAQLADCAARRDDAERLACFDTITDRLEVQPSGEASPGGDESAFGEEFLRRDETPEPERGPSSISTTIERLERRPRGEHVFHLGNGQAWTELEAGRFRYREGMTVTIERTTFGSYMLSTGTGRATRVRRVE